MIKGLKNFYPVLFLVIIILVCSALLMGADKVNRMVLESQQDPAIIALLQQIFPEATFYRYNADEEIYTVYDSGRQKTGYAMYGAGYGYRGKITVLAGLKDKETIKNIIIISQSEDLSFWNKLITDKYLDQFIELPVEECYASYSWLPGGVDSVSGSTYSSKGVVSAVRDAILDKLEYLD